MKNKLIVLLILLLGLQFVGCSNTPTSSSEDLPEEEIISKLPEGIAEIDVVIGEKYPLAGKITYPESISELTPAVVLVHGSGANNMDSAIGGTAIFEDLAYELAKQGIIVIRYDKRTYTYGAQIATENFSEFTVQEETIEDAVLAKEVVANFEYTDPERIYLIGHSMGGMLAPIIDQQADFAGIIILAGTPRSMIDVMVSQLNDALEQTTNSYEIKVINQNIELIESIKEMSVEQAKELNLGSMYGFYLLDFEKYDFLAALKEIEKPILILQGSEDFQVKVERDYQLYVDGLSEKENVFFQLYPGLNHLFMISGGENQYTVAEYDAENHVAAEVIQDIVTFIKNGTLGDE